MQNLHESTPEVVKTSADAESLHWQSGRPFGYLMGTELAFDENAEYRAGMDDVNFAPKIFAGVVVTYPHTSLPLRKDRFETLEEAKEYCERIRKEYLIKNEYKAIFSKADFLTSHVAVIEPKIDKPFDELKRLRAAKDS